NRSEDALSPQAPALAARQSTLEHLAKRLCGHTVIVLTATGRVKGKLVGWRDSCLVLERDDARVALPAACIRSLSAQS
ncbi:MAG: hypothetical protein OWT27_03250, partial [Firmicutes bacterium]|nr:hypothetical protein [Bacillota bacterium]